MFETRAIPEAKPLKFLRRTTIVFVIAFLCIGAMSTYRAWVQVRHLELRSDPVLHTGSIVETDVTSSARNGIAVRLELVQGAHAETLDLLKLRGNELGFFDPRSKRAAQKIILTTDHLARFEPGDAVLRATGTGGPEWGRIPPPVIREMPVMITR